MPTQARQCSNSLKNHNSSQGLVLSKYGAPLSPLAGIYWVPITTAVPCGSTGKGKGKGPCCTISAKGTGGTTGI